jgi:hypothetical protein
MTGWARFSVPSKAFILGEYAVLEGAPALVATLSPRFELRKEGTAHGPARGVRLREFSPDSPARKFLQDEKGEFLLESSFVDPHRGAGGFGGSTAEFALSYAALKGPASAVKDVWADYRRVQPQASGADLAAQWAGGAVIADPGTRSVERLLVERMFRNWFVFSAAHQPGRKVKTHEHLEALRRADLSRLAKSDVLSTGLKAAQTGFFEDFARSVNEYAALLRSHGFELAQTTEDRAALRDVRGVCAVKGTGAMQADALVVFGDPDMDLATFRENLLEVAEKRDLRLVASGWKEESGIL